MVAIAQLAREAINQPAPAHQLDLSISPGKYRVLTFDYKPAPEIHLIVHHLRRD